MKNIQTIALIAAAAVIGYSANQGSQAGVTVAPPPARECPNLKAWAYDEELAKAQCRTLAWEATQPPPKTYPPGQSPTELLIKKMFRAFD